MLVLGTVVSDFYLFLFQGFQELAKLTIGQPFYSLIMFSSLRYSHDLSVLAPLTGGVNLSRNVRNKSGVAAHTKTVEEY